MMPTDTYMIPLGYVLWGIVLLFALLAYVFYYWKHAQEQNSQMQWLAQAENRLSELQNQLQSHIDHQDSRQQHWGLLLEKRISTQQAQSENLGHLHQKIESLTQVMSHNAHRGAYGETQLHHLLTDMFPSQVLKFQHTLGNNRRVDAAIWLSPIERWLCIDAKFPLEDFEADPTEDEVKRFKVRLKKHIKDIHDRYHLPSETTEMSVLFLPAEGLFIWIHRYAYDILQYAHAQKVWLASPSTLPSLLHITLSLMKDHSIDLQSKAFMKEFQNLLSIVSAHSKSIQMLEKSLHHHQQHLWSLVQHHQALHKSLQNIQTDGNSIQSDPPVHITNHDDLS